jgi:hypothetical protein
MVEGLSPKLLREKPQAFYASSGSKPPNGAIPLQDPAGKPLPSGPAARGAPARTES